MEGSIIAVGDCVLDLLCTALPGLPEGDRQLSMGRIVPAPGGNTLNFALAAGAVHDDVVFHGAVGDDPFGDMLTELVSRYPLDARIARSRDVGTATTVAIPDRRGGRRLLTHAGANAIFDPDLEGIDLDGAAHLHRGGYWFTEGLAKAKDLELLRAAREAGVETSLDPATDPNGWDVGRIGRFLRLLPFVDILFLNEAELIGISGSEDQGEGIRSLLRLGAGSVVLHRGERGILWEGRVGSGSMEAFDLDVIDNPTGTGDVFNGAFVALRVKGWSLEEAISGAQAAAALHMGNRDEPYPSLERIVSFLRA